MQQSFGLIGLNFKAAPVAVREKLSLDSQGLSELLENSKGILSGLSVLATCNRVEFYAEIRPGLPVMDTIRSVIATVVALDDVEIYVYEKTDMDAAHHLGRVAAGLDSMVLGEPQILGQVAEALQWSETNGMASSRISAVFQMALTAGRRARQETALSRKPVSVASVAVEWMRRKIGGLEDQHIAILGLGETGGLVAKILQNEPIGQLTFVHRNSERAIELAAQACADAVPLEELKATIRAADILVCATNAPHTVIDATHIEPRGQRPLLLIDLAVPRDVEQSVGAHPNVCLVDVDALRTGVDESLAERHAQVPQVEAILDEELGQLKGRLKILAIEPVIGDIRRIAEDLRKAELNRILDRVESLTPELERNLEYFSHSLINKLLHVPTRQLRHHIVQNGDAEHAASMLRRLFALADPVPNE